MQILDRWDRAFRILLVAWGHTCIAGFGLDWTRGKGKGKEREGKEKVLRLVLGLVWGFMGDVAYADAVAVAFAIGYAGNDLGR